MFCIFAHVKFDRRHRVWALCGCIQSLAVKAIESGMDSQAMDDICVLRLMKCTFLFVLHCDAFGKKNVLLLEEFDERILFSTLNVCDRNYYNRIRNIFIHGVLHSWFS